jgi:membrane protease YdiL (CAAX protease family)
VYALIAVPVAYVGLYVTGTTLPWATLPGLVGALLGARVLGGIEGRPGASLGFPLDRRAPAEAGLGLALGIGVAAVGIGLMALAGAVAWRADAGGGAAWLKTALSALWLLAIPAAAEEALVRGYPLRAIAEAKGPAWALGVTAFGFAALHLPNLRDLPGLAPLALVNLAAAGLFLGALVLRTGNLWWATGAHVGWNWALAFLADLPLSGLEVIDAPLLEGEARGSVWLSGGAFGPEASVLVGGVLIGAAAWSWRSRRLSRRAG